MKRYLRYVVAAAAIGAVAALSAIAMGASGPKATGDIWWYNPTNQLVHATFSAQPTTNGAALPATDAKGQVSVWVYDHSGNTLQWSYTGDVTYYNQTGNKACFVGDITSTYNIPTSANFEWWVEDNGEGTNSSPDLITTHSNTGTSCTPSSSYAGTITMGNLQVHQ